MLVFSPQTDRVTKVSERLGIFSFRVPSTYARSDAMKYDILKLACEGSLMIVVSR